MRKIDPPSESADEVFETCVNTTHNTGDRTRLLAYKGSIIAAEASMLERIRAEEFHLVEQGLDVGGNVTADELKHVYTYRLVKTDEGRKIYDKILMAAPLGICPICSVSPVKTLDHYYPKSLYPKLSVIPINLIPSCTDCNKRKSTYAPTSPEEATLHPYFDDIEQISWLSAEVSHTSPPTVIFFPNINDSVPEVLRKRIENHFRDFGLSASFAIQAAVEMTGNSPYFLKLFQRGGSMNLRAYLADLAESNSTTNPNSWKAAMYKALASDDWFCNGGFAS